MPIRFLRSQCANDLSKANARCYTENCDVIGPFPRITRSADAR